MNLIDNSIENTNSQQVDTNVIGDIEKFKEIYSNKDDFFIINNFTEEILEYYFNNNSGVQVEANNISIYQTLSDTFINKYADRLNWVGLFKNNNIKLSYDVTVKNIYHFNLYEVYMNIKDNELYVVLINRLVNKYMAKLSIDKIHYEFNFK